MVAPTDSTAESTSAHRLDILTAAYRDAGIALHQPASVDDRAILEDSVLGVAQKIRALSQRLPSAPPLISVLIPFYNHHEYMAACLESLAQQTFQNFEVSIYDDGSTEPLIKKIVRSTLGGAALRLHRNPTNLGPAHTRNWLLAHARGAYIAWQDADDYSSPHRLWEQLTYLLQHPAVQGVGTAITQTARNASDSCVVYPTHACDGHYFNGCCASFMLRLDAAKAAGQYDTNWSHAGEDVDFFMRIKPASSLHNLPTALYHYRQHPDQLTAQPNFALSSTYLCLIQLLRSHHLTPSASPDQMQRTIEHFIDLHSRVYDGSDMAEIYVHRCMQNAQQDRTARAYLVPLAVKMPKSFYHLARHIRCNEQRLLTYPRQMRMLCALLWQLLRTAGWVLMAILRFIYRQGRALGKRFLRLGGGGKQRQPAAPSLAAPVASPQPAPSKSSRWQGFWQLIGALLGRLAQEVRLCYQFWTDAACVRGLIRSIAAKVRSLCQWPQRIRAIYYALVLSESIQTSAQISIPTITSQQLDTAYNAYQTLLDQHSLCPTEKDPTACIEQMMALRCTPLNATPFKVKYITVILQRIRAGEQSLLYLPYLAAQYPAIALRQPQLVTRARINRLLMRLLRSRT